MDLEGIGESVGKVQLGGRNAVEGRTHEETSKKSRQGRIQFC